MGGRKCQRRPSIGLGSDLQLIALPLMRSRSNLAGDDFGRVRAVLAFLQEKPDSSGLSLDVSLYHDLSYWNQVGFFLGIIAL